MTIELEQPTVDSLAAVGETGEVMEIREVRQDELGAAARMWAQAWSESYSGVVPDDVTAARTSDDFLAHAVSSWRAAMDRGLTYWVVVRDGSITGIAHVRPSRDVDAPTPVELTMIYLLESEKGSGAAQQLLMAAAQQAACSLWVLANNERAIRFYTKQGFRKDGAIRQAFEGHRGVLEERMVRPARV
ncbi:GNAT family N-acetyltransferase [Tessaracoccus massiliensis]|uniref:GNAT family N-acetyltransferase n=1 Tax=Tessaracoccus massiliensis TaxID=1522311 RepID=UPI000694D9F6|nr:GNAT family N-acetyltransferase [Tessaracoccus massiliensis]